jgi:hypothetical protein
MLIFEDIYEPIKFQIKNRDGEVFDCQTQPRTIKDNIEIEKLGQIKFDDDGKIIDSDVTVNEKSLKMLVLMCGQTEEFWSQFSDVAVTAVIQKIVELEKERFKKKQAK